VTRFHLPSRLTKRFGVSLATAALFLAGTQRAVAQDGDPLLKLDQQSRFTIDLLIDSARVAGLPTRPLLSKAQEGVAKHAEARRIVEACHRYLGLLRVARSTLGPVGEQEIVAAAAVLEAGGKPDQLRSFRARQQDRSDLQAFTVWADFLARGVPNQDASQAIAKLWQDGADDAAFHSLWQNVQADILQGLNPGTALQNRIRESPGRAPTTTGKPPEGTQENQSSE
jgi:hypothetical protein